MKAIVFFFAFTFYMAVSNVNSAPVDPDPIVFVLQRRKFEFTRRRCSNLSTIRIDC